MLLEEEIARLAAENAEPRMLNIFVLDDSSSMILDGRINAVNKSLPLIGELGVKDSLAAKRGAFALVTVSSPQLLVDFVSPADFKPPWLQAKGGTNLGAATSLALKHLNQTCLAYQANGIRLYRPNVFIISDGESGDDITAPAAALRKADAARQLNVFAIGVGDIDLALLKPFTHTYAPKRLDGVKFAEFFEWVTLTVKAVSKTSSYTGGNPADTAKLPSTGDWENA